MRILSPLIRDPLVMRVLGKFGQYRRLPELAPTKKIPISEIGLAGVTARIRAICIRSGPFEMRRRLLSAQH
jgi:hypothetical protein